MKEELIHKAMNNDKNAFSDLIEELEDLLYKIAKTRLNSEDDICDAIQETIISAYKAINKLEDAKFFKTWIIRILINKCNDIYKANRIKNLFILKDNINEIEHLKKEDDYEKVEIKLDFENILKILNYKERIIMTLYYSEDLTIKEISQILKMNENTVKTKMSRAKSKIKKEFEGELYE